MKTNHPMPRFRQHLLACVSMLGAGLGAGNAQAQTTLEVGGADVIGDTVLTTAAGVAKVPAAGATWTAAGGTLNRYSSLKSPTVVVPTTGALTLRFTHRYNFESGWDGGAVYISVNGGAATYLAGTAFTAHGYVSDLTTNDSNVFTGGEQVFTGQSADYAGPTLIESVADLGTFNASDTVVVEFRGGWDDGTVAGAPNWEIGSVQISDGASTAVLDAGFTADGTAGFTVTSSSGLEGPWTYLKPISKFELDADTLTADRYAPDVAGSVIDLNGCVLAVEVLTGTLDANESFSLFNLAGGTTLTGSVANITLPLGIWDTSTLATTGSITYLGPPPPTYIGPNTTGNANTWNTAANWNTGIVPNGTDDVVIPDGKYVVANNASTPAYSGDLSIGAAATLQIGYTTAIPLAYNALGTPGSTTISMGAGALISTRNAGSPVIPAITLLGDAKIRLGESTQVPANADFNYPITGAFTMTIESNQQTPTIDLNASNSIAALVINTLSGRGSPAGTFNANAAGCLGNGPVTINPNGTLSHKLAFKVALASTAANTLNLYGEGPSGNGAGKLRMDADNTVGFLNIYGFAYPAGTYGRVGTPATVDNQVAWIEGDAVLTVANEPEDTSPPTVAITDNFPSGSIFLGQTASYTLTFNEAVQSATVGADDFENAGSAPVTIDSVTADVTLGVYTVKVTPTGTGSLTLNIKSDAVITDLFGNNLVPVGDNTTLTVNPLTLKGQLGVWKQYANGGINPATGNPWAAGDTYRLAFVTSTTRNATSTDIADYNSFVQGVAAASVQFPDLGTATWKVLGSTASVAARDNTGTNPTTNGTGVAVILMDGSTVFATNNADLWNGSPARTDVAGVYMSPYLNQEGVEPAQASVFTGTQASGISEASRVLGGSTEVPPKVTTGQIRPNNGSRWLVQYNASATSSLQFFAISEPLTVSSIAGGNTYADWIAEFPGVGGSTGLGDDPDGDGITNGAENIFGTDPGASSTGLVAGAVNGSTFTFTHPQNATPASDLTAAYRWSKDLAAFHAGGAADGGTTVDFTIQLDTPTPGITTVTATVTGTATSKLFVNIEVTQD